MTRPSPAVGVLRFAPVFHAFHAFHVAPVFHVVVVMAALAAGAAAAVVVWFHVPVTDALIRHGLIVRWFWPFRDKPAGGLAGLAALLVLTGLLIALATGRIRLGRIATPAAFVVLGTLLQFAFAGLEGRGIDALRDRATQTGHTEFVNTAVAQDDILYLLKNYESLLAGGALGYYGPSKPPGTLLAYVATDRLVNAFAPMPQADPEQRQARAARLATAMAWSWPLLAALAAVPLYGLGLLWLSPAAARLAVGLTLLTPSMQLVTLHTDQAVFPLLFLTCLWLAGLAIRRVQHGRPARLAGAVAGAAVHAAVFCQLPMSLAAVPIGLTLALVWWRDRPARGALTGMALAMAGGFLLSAGLLYGLFDYDPVRRYLGAMEGHVGWQGWRPEWRFQAALANIVEYGLWLGMAVLLLHGAAAVAAVRASVGRANGSQAGMERIDSPAVTGIVAGSALIMLYLMLFGRTMAEVARLWLFLMPCSCFAAAWFLARDGRLWTRTATILLWLQAFSVYAIKLNQDFH